MNNRMEERLRECYDELKWLYCELYHNDTAGFEYFLGMLRKCYDERRDALRNRDEERLQNPDWYRSGKLLGMMMYVDAFAGNLKGLEEKLPYIRECGVNYLHLMPLLKTVKERSDGGYAVADFRSVAPELGTMEDLEQLADVCHESGISLCLDFVMNHTSEDHAWAKAARAGDPEAMRRYFFYDSWDIPNEYEKTVPQVFPTTAPGNFTYLPDCRKVVMTFFYPFQWDLNYQNNVVFHDMTENLLFLANRGIDVIRLDAVPYIWKALGTDCRNLPQVHTLVRMMNLACHVVCPGVLLLGEVVMEPAKVAPYFGTVEKPECQILYNVTTMCTTWHTLATRDVRLLKEQMKQVFALPASCVFQNYLRCHDDIGWGLDYAFLKPFGMEEVPHKKYLNDYYTGKWEGSPSRGELYNDDPRLGDARLCGTTASLCGLETAATEEEKHTALSCDEMLHAFMLSQSGIPVLYSGDEIAQRNDYSYHEDPDRRDDSRYVHRGRFRWDLAEHRQDETTCEGWLFEALRSLETIRAKYPVFRADAHCAVIETGSDQVLGICRQAQAQGNEEKLFALYNFCPEPRTVKNPAPGAACLTAGYQKNLRPEALADDTLTLPGYGFVWMLMENNE